MLRRWGLFILTNILIITMLSIVLNVLGVEPYLSEAGLDYQNLMVFCLVWGMVGSLISLAMSRVMAKMMLQVKVISPENPGEHEWLVRRVHELSKAAGLPAMPEVGVYNSADVNAFATGPTKSRSLVAVSTGLLQQMNREEADGVLAHEVAHIQNGDMVTMTLLQGIINAFVMFFARIVAFAISQNVRSDMRPMVNFFTIIVLQILFGMLGMMVTGWFSRKREFRADAGSATLGGTNNMIAALEALKRIQGKIRGPQEEHESLATLQISNNSGKKSFLALLSTHPALDDRIAALKMR